MCRNSGMKQVGIFRISFILVKKSAGVFEIQIPVHVHVMRSPIRSSPVLLVPRVYF